jgi:pimeloyl-ACP methyl ester carboxylesterase
MKNLRIYGKAPFTIAVIHGGPGAPGEMAPVANHLSAQYGVLEPFQTASSLIGQAEELETLLKQYGRPPMTIIGFSWGAWVGYVCSSLHPSVVKKLILISCGPFEDKDVPGIMKTRLSRLSSREQTELQSIQDAFQDHTIRDKNAVFARFGALMFKADSYDPFPYEHNVIQFDYSLFQQVWRDTSNLRSSGELLQFGRKIRCPVVAIHGEYDPHPASGVRNSLSGVCRDFRFIVLKKCGHYPWMEKFAYKKFYDILLREVRDHETETEFL